MRSNSALWWQYEIALLDYSEISIAFDWMIDFGGLQVNIDNDSVDDIADGMIVQAARWLAWLPSVDVSGWAEPTNSSLLSNCLASQPIHFPIFLARQYIPLFSPMNIAIRPIPDLSLQTKEVAIIFFWNRFSWKINCPLWIQRRQNLGPENKCHKQH